MEKERLQKILSSLGICSRRKAEQLISDGKVKVNGIIIDQLGFKCTLEDKIEIEGVVVNNKNNNKNIYLAFNKPYNVVSTLSDPQGRETVLDYIPPKYGRVFPVGRLDHNSTGLMIFTNDGEFANLVTHPSSAPEKEYLVKVKNKLRGDEVEKLAQGLYVYQDGYKAQPCKATVIKNEEDYAVLSIILKEGKKRQIRHMMETLDHPVQMLIRIRIGSIMLNQLKEGCVEEIPSEQIQEIFEQCRFNKEHNNFQKGTVNGSADEIE